MVGEIVRKTADGTSKKLIDMIVSGYSDLVHYGWLAIIAGVAGLPIDFSKIVNEPEKRKHLEIEINEGSTESQTQKVVEAVKKELKSYWRCFQS